MEIESKVTIVTIVRRQKVYLLEILLRKQAHGKRRNLLSNIFIPSRRFVREKRRDIKDRSRFVEKVEEMNGTARV